ncbi:hypothetical protein ACH5RR_018931 [Cinchona calisaya]|uniref:Uncharacterized protein n=1 Tax=Cinchona calisaya TaxID=153742 RepID=A0ABD2ZMW9_9GENT
MNALNNPQFDDGAFIETNDLTNPISADTFDLSFGETQPDIQSSEKLLGSNGDIASSSKQELSIVYGTDFQYPFIKQASRMLESISAPPAFASEFPPKDATLHLYPSSQSSSIAHVTASMIQIGNIGPGGHGMDLFSGKHGRYNVLLSFGLSRGDDDSTTLELVVSIHPAKTASGFFRGWFYFIFFWILVLSVGFKIGTYI